MPFYPRYFDEKIFIMILSKNSRKYRGFSFFSLYPRYFDEKSFQIYFEGAIPRERAADVKGRWRDVDGADERDASRVETICQHREKQKVSILY